MDQSDSTATADLEPRPQPAGARSASAAAKREAPPTEIGRFLILREAGAGGMGVVYVAYDPELDRKVAVKLLQPGVSGSDREESARVRLIREAKAMARLSHPNVVAVYDVGTYRGQVFIAMEYVEGEALATWLRSASRARAEVLRVFLEAGRGLAAAHREGLVHGDFKPDNVLVDRGGRVRVVDFGLASTQGEPSRDGETARTEEPASARSAIDLSTRVTRSGAFAGTPAYLAPEIFAGAARSPRSDQFSFCVSLHEGLYGARPFHGHDVKELGRAIAAGPPPESREHALPSWLRRIVVRGLSPAPEGRFPDMDALLAALARDPGRRRRRIAAFVGVVLALVAAALVYRALLMRALEERQGLCAGGEAELVGVWDPERRSAVERALLATGLPYAADVWERVAARLDARAAAWVAMHGEACRATHLRGEQSPALRDLRMACLQRRLLETRSLVDVLVDADAGVVENAAQASAQLTPLDACADAAGLLSAEGPARSEADAAAVAELRARLAQVRALVVTARLQAGLELTDQALAIAEALGDRPLIAEARMARGEVLDDLGDPRALEALRSAFFVGEASGDDLILPRIALALLHTTTSRLDLERAEEWSRHARALLDRLGARRPAESRQLEAQYASRLGTLHVHAGRLDEADRAFRAALELANPDDDLFRAGIHNNLGNLLVRRGDLTAAGAALDRSADLYRALLGPRHPSVAIALNNLGELALRQGRWADALAIDEEARAILRAAFGPDHPHVGVLENNLGQARLHLGDPEAAADHFERARAIFAAAFGDDAAPLAYPLTGLGEARIAAGHLAEARTILERALLLREGSGPAERGGTRFALARALVDVDPERALDLAAQAASDFAEAGPAYARERGEGGAWLAAHPRSERRDLNVSRPLGSPTSPR